MKGWFLLSWRYTHQHLYIYIHKTSNKTYPHPKGEFEPKLQDVCNELIWIGLGLPCFSNHFVRRSKGLKGVGSNKWCPPVQGTHFEQFIDVKPRSQGVPSSNHIRSIGTGKTECERDQESCDIKRVFNMWTNNATVFLPAHISLLRLPPSVKW